MISDEDGEVKSYREHLWQTKQPFLSDVLLFKLMEMQLNECTETAVRKDRTLSAGYASSAKDTAWLVKSLKIVALENLTRVREVMVRELHCELFPVVNEFNALYAYNVGLFKECMKMCRLDIRMFQRTFSQYYYVMYPEMLSLLDGELVSVLSLIHI